MATKFKRPTFNFKGSMSILWSHMSVIMGRMLRQFEPGQQRILV